VALSAVVVEEVTLYTFHIHVIVSQKMKDELITTHCSLIQSQSTIFISLRRRNFVMLR
jgi:hypothetical protein